MTWEEFKAAVEAAGVKDDDVIGYIDVSGGPAEDIDVIQEMGGEITISD